MRNALLIEVACRHPKAELDGLISRVPYLHELGDMMDVLPVPQPVPCLCRPPEYRPVGMFPPFSVGAVAWGYRYSSKFQRV